MAMLHIVTFVFILISFSIIEVINGHVVLTFPPARTYPLDFLDNIRTPGPCGIPKGLGPVTNLTVGSIVNVTWHVAYPHRGGYMLSLLNENDRVIYNITQRTVTNRYVNSNDPTRLHHEFTVPNISCSNCSIQIIRLAGEWWAGPVCGPDYIFWSCADINIVQNQENSDLCNGHSYQNGQCVCSKPYKGSRCQYKEDCFDDGDCSNHGNCVHTDATYYPKQQCYCDPGWFGIHCEKASPVNSTDIDFSLYTSTNVSDEYQLSYRILLVENELEVVLKVKTETWVGFGWRPSSLRSECQNFPALPGDNAGSTPGPTSEPEGTAEPTSEPEGTPEPTSEPEVTPEPTSEPEVTPEPTSEPEVIPEPTSEPEQTPEPTSEPEQTPEPTSEPEQTPEPTSEPEQTPEPTSEPEQTPEPTSEPEQTPEPTSEPEQTPEPTSEPEQTPEPTSEPEQTPEPTSEPEQTPEPTSEPEQTPEPTSEPEQTPEPTSEPEQTPEPTSEPEQTPEPTSEPEQTPEPNIAPWNHSCSNVMTLCLNRSPACQYWAMLEYNGTDITFQLAANISSSQWVAIGFSDTPSMTDSDVYVGYMNLQQQIIVQDRNVGAYKTQPAMDAIQNIMDVEGNYSSGYLYVKFVRKRNTMDGTDALLTDGQCHHLLMAWGGSVSSSGILGYHQSNKNLTMEKVCFQTCGGTTSHPEPASSAEPEPVSTPEPHQPLTCMGAWKSCTDTMPDNCDYAMSWVYNSSTDTVTFSVSANVMESQWFAIGFSNNTQMPFSDVYFGAYNSTSSSIVVTDRFTESPYRAMPTKDSSQNHFNVSGSRVGSRNTMMFSRKRNTTDAQRDFIFTDSNPAYFFFAWGGSYYMMADLAEKHQHVYISSEPIYIKACVISLGAENTTEPTSEPEQTPEPTSEPEQTPEPTSEPEQTPEPTSEPEQTPEPTSEPEQTPAPTSEPEQTPEPTSEPEQTPEPTSEPEQTPEPTSEPEQTPEPTSEPEQTPEPTSEPEQTPEPTSEPEQTPEPTSEPEQTPEPTSEPEQTPEPTSEPEQTPEPTSEPEGTPEPEGSTSEPEGEGGSGGCGTRPVLPGAIPHAMDCTDMVIGTARGMRSRIGDYYSRDRSTPLHDEAYGGTQSLTAAVGFEENGYTTILFRKKLLASEREDFSITNSFMHVIWARGQDAGRYVHVPPTGIDGSTTASDPDYYKVDELKYHGHRSHRGVRTLNFMLGKSYAPTRLVEVRIKIIGHPWYRFYEDPTTPEYRNLHKDMDEGLTEYLTANLQGFLRVRNITFSSGSIRVHFGIVFENSRSAVVTSLNNLVQTVSMIHGYSLDKQELDISSAVLYTETDPVRTTPTPPRACEGSWGSCNAEDANCYLVRWSYNDSTGLITFTVQVYLEDNQWAALGFSSNTQMPDTDVVVGYVRPDGQGVLQDRYALGKYMPAIDSSSDVNLVSSSRQNKITKFEFTRSPTTADTTQDFQFTMTNCAYFFYAKGGTYTNSGDITYHDQTPIISQEKICIPCPVPSTTAPGMSTTGVMPSSIPPSASPSTPPRTPAPNATVYVMRGEFAITGFLFIPDHGDKNTQAYKNLERDMKNALTAVLQSMTGFDSVVIYGFRSGSIIVDFGVLYKTVDQSASESAVRDTLDKIKQNRTLAGFTLDPGSFTVQSPQEYKEEDVTVPPMEDEDLPPALIVIIAVAGAGLLLVLILGTCNCVRTSRMKKNLPSEVPWDNGRDDRRLMSYMSNGSGNEKAYTEIGSIKISYNEWLKRQESEGYTNRAYEDLPAQNTNSFTFKDERL